MRVKCEDNPNLKVELNKYGYPEVYYSQNGKWFLIDVSTKEGLEKLSLFSNSPFDKVKPLKQPRVLKKKRPTKGFKKKK